MIRAANALKIYQEKEAALTHYPRKHHYAQNALFTYTLFSAALLTKIGAIFTHYRIGITQENGVLIKQWQPLGGPLPDEGSHYKIQRQENPDQVLNKYLTPIIAKQLMPKNGMDWIASNEEMLKMWLAVLQGDEAYAGTLAHILSLAEQKIASLFEIDAREQLDDVAIEELAEHKHEAIEDFINFLESNIKEGKMDGESLITEDAIVVTPKVIKQFYDAFPNHKVSMGVAFTNQHNMLGISPKSGDDKVFKKYFGQKGIEGVNIKVNTSLGKNLPTINQTNTLSSTAYKFTTTKK